MAFDRDAGKVLLKQNWEKQIAAAEEKLKDLGKLDDDCKTKISDLRNRVSRYYNPTLDYQAISKNLLAIQQKVAQFQIAKAKEEHKRHEEETEKRIADAKKLSQFPEISDKKGGLSGCFSALFCCCCRKTETPGKYRRLVNP